MNRRDRSHIEEWASLLDADVPDDMVGDGRRRSEGWTARRSEGWTAE